MWIVESFWEIFRAHLVNILSEDSSQVFFSPVENPHLVMQGNLHQGIHAPPLMCIFPIRPSPSERQNQEMGKKGQLQCALR